MLVTPIPADVRAALLAAHARRSPDMNPTALQRLLPLNAGAVRVHGGPEEMPYDDVRGKGWTLTSCDGDIFITIDALSDPMPHDRITIARNLAYAAEAIANLSAVLLDNELNKEPTP